MKAVIRLAALTLLLLPAMASAQEPQSHPLVGYWRGPLFEGATENEEITVELRIEGDVVTGPISTSKIGDLYIRNGSLTGNTLQFTTPNFEPDASTVPLVWTGQLSGNNELAFSVVPENGDGPARELVLTKRLPVPGGGR